MTDVERAYIAGFLDGDGSIILQIVRRKDYVLGFQIRASICFYQKVTGSLVLEWIKRRLINGYIRQRGEMADYTIVGLKRVRDVLHEVGPYVVLKAKQVELARSIIVEAQFIETRSNLLSVAQQVDAFAALNYSKCRRVTSETVRRFGQGT